MLAKVTQFMEATGMPPVGTPLLVALSGGSDSVGLLLILHELGYSVVAAHCNYGLRAAAATEEAWVIDFAASLSIPCHVRRFTAHDFERLAGEGTQQAARKLRYAFFEELMAAHGLSYCATGHQADDQTETQVLSFFRGNGPQLLRSIPPVRGPYIRPLLCLRRQEIQDWIAARGEAWCHDASNDANDYLRNRVRNELLPAVVRLNPNYQARFQRQAERYARQQAWLHAQLGRLAPAIVEATADEAVVSLTACREAMGEGNAVIFLEWWLDQRGFLGTEIETIVGLLSVQTGARVVLQGTEVLRDRDSLRFRAAQGQAVVAPLTLDFDPAAGAVIEIEYVGERIALRVVAPPSTFTAAADRESHWLDLSKLSLPLRIRLWQQGDRMQPLGMQGTKLVSDILIDQKRDLFTKSRTWVLEDGVGIVLVAGFRIADRVALRGRDGGQCLRIDRFQSV